DPYKGGLSIFFSPQHSQTHLLLNPLQASCGLFPMVGIHEGSGVEKTERRTSQEQSLREGMQPLTQRLQPTSCNEGPGVLFDQAGGLFKCSSRQRMEHGLGEELMLFIP